MIITTFKKSYIWRSIFIFYAVIASLLILSGDDWAWGSEEGWSRLENGFDYYNGRYLGNIIEIFITRSLLFRIAMYALVNTGIVYVTWLLLNRKFNIPLIMLLIISMPISIYGETYGWLAGFANYNTSLLAILYILYVAKKKQPKMIELFFVGIIAFLGQFFVENVSVASVVMAVIGLLLALFYKEKKAVFIVWLMGATVGAYIMFSNTAYHTEGNMREVGGLDFTLLFTTMITSWSEFYFKDNLILIVLFTIVLAIIGKGQKYLVGSILVIAMYFIIRNLVGLSPASLPYYLLVVEFILMCIYLIALLIIVGKSKVKNENKRYFYTYFLYAIILLGPFLLITPFGPRNMLLTYMLLVICLLLICDEKILGWLRKGNKLVVLAVIGFCMTFIIMHGANKIENHTRYDQLVEEYEAGAKFSTLTRLPFEKIGHDLTPKFNNLQRQRQIEYYNLPPDIRIRLSNYIHIEPEPPYGPIEPKYLR